MRIALRNKSEPQAAYQCFLNGEARRPVRMSPQQCENSQQNIRLAKPVFPDSFSSFTSSVTAREILHSTCRLAAPKSGNAQ